MTLQKILPLIEQDMQIRIVDYTGVKITRGMSPKCVYQGSVFGVPEFLKVSKKRVFQDVTERGGVLRIELDDDAPHWPSKPEEESE